MWSLTSPRADRISGPEKFHSSAREDFFNSIGTFRTRWGELTMSAPEGRADSLFGLIGFMSTRPSTTLADLNYDGIPKSVFQ
jgi:hypothetical protein